MMAKRPGLLSWQDYKIFRFQKLRNELFRADFRELGFPRHVSPQLVKTEQEPAGEIVIDPIGSTGSTTIAEDTSIFFSPRENPTSINQDPLAARLLRNPKLDIVYSAGAQGLEHPGPYRLHERVGWALGKHPASDVTKCDPFWQEASLLFNLQIVDDRDEYIPPFQYLSSRLDAACGAKYAIWSDFVRDFYLTPLVCLWASDGSNDLETPFVAGLRNQLEMTGSVQYNLSQVRLGDFPRLWAPGMLLFVTSDPEHALPPKENLPDQVLCVLVNLSPGPLPHSVSSDWHLAISIGAPAKSSGLDLPGLIPPWQGWIGAEEPGALLSLLDMRAHAYHLQRIVNYVLEPPPPCTDLSVIITTYHRPDLLSQAVRSIAHQTLPRSRYEILVVNNDPADLQTRRMVETLRGELFRENPQSIRLVEAPIAGLSYARNAGLAEANGELICFLDDDALAHPDWLDRIWRAFSAHPRAGVVGGHIRLRVPEPRPKVLKPGLERFWTQFIPGHDDYREAEQWMEYPWGANWCARRQVLLEMGGFRGQYGRRKNDFSGGEEIIAASLAEQLGYTVGIEPGAMVDHQPDLSRFTYSYLRKTIISQIIINYRMKRDLYLPKSITILNNLRGTQRFLKNLLNFFKLPAEERGAVGLEYFYLVQAWARLSVDQLSDLLWRFYYRRHGQW